MPDDRTPRAYSGALSVAGGSGSLSRLVLGAEIGRAASVSGPTASGPRSRARPLVRPPCSYQIARPAQLPSTGRGRARVPPITGAYRRRGLAADRPTLERPGPPAPQARPRPGPARRRTRSVVAPGGRKIEHGGRPTGIRHSNQAVGTTAWIGPPRTEDSREPTPSCMVRRSR